MNKVFIKFFVVIGSFLFLPNLILEASSNGSKKIDLLNLRPTEEIKKESIVENEDLLLIEDDYILDKGDSILVSIYGYPELSKIYNINLDRSTLLPTNSSNDLSTNF